MSDYTTQIRWLRSSNFNFGLKSYPIFDENYRDTLNGKILDHYQFREIGFETAAMFKFYLNTTLNEIMPYYNKMYLLLLDDKKLFINTDLTEDYLKQNDGKFVLKSDGTGSQNFEDNRTQKNTTEQNNKGKSVSSNTPQAFLNSDDINADRYASLAELSSGEISDNSNIKFGGDTQTDTSFNNNSENTVDNTENYLKHLSGNNGGKYNYQIINDLKDKIIDVDIMIINELSNLFMLIY